MELLEAYEEIFNNIDAKIKRDKKIKNYLLFIGYQEMGQEDETMNIKQLSSYEEDKEVLTILEKAHKTLTLPDPNAPDPNVILIKTHKDNFNQFVNQSLVDDVISYAIEKFKTLKKLKIILLITELKDQSEHSYQKLKNLINIRSTTDNKEHTIYFLSRAIEEYTIKIYGTKND